MAAMTAAQARLQTFTLLTILTAYPALSWRVADPAFQKMLMVEVRTGGFTPAIATGLIEYTGDKSAPGMWMTAAAACGLIATLYLYRKSGNQRTVPA